MEQNNMIKLKFAKPVIAQCRTCFKKYDMVEWGVNCPNCRDKPKDSKDRK